MNKKYLFFILIIFFFYFGSSFTVFSSQKLNLSVLDLIPVPESSNEFFLILSSKEDLNVPYAKLDISYDNKDFTKGEVLNSVSLKWVKYRTHWPNSLSLNFLNNFPLILKIRLLDMPKDLDLFYIRLRYKEDLDKSTVSTYFFQDSVSVKNVSLENIKKDLDKNSSDNSNESLKSDSNRDSDSSPSKDSQDKDLPQDFLQKDLDAIEENSKDERFEKPDQKLLTPEEKKNIFITEFMPNPSDGEEWVEIYNNNDTSVNLNNWSIDDVLDGGGLPVVFSAELEPKQYYVVSINKSLLNNSGDSLHLLDENNNPLYKVNYKKSIKGSSIQKLSNGNWYITSDSTPEKKNLNFEEVTIVSLDEFKKESSTEEEASVSNSKDISGSVSAEQNDIEKKEGSKSLDNDSQIPLTLNKGEILGSKSINIVYKKVPYFVSSSSKGNQNFFNQESGKVIILTQDKVPTPYEVVKTFIKRLML